jgi:hypothetical protein
MWKIKNFEMNYDSDIVNALVVLKDDQLVVESRTFPAWVDKADKIIVDDAEYDRSTPVWEELMRLWMRVQNIYIRNYPSIQDYLDQLPQLQEFEKSFDTPLEYIKHLKTELALLR